MHTLMWMRVVFPAPVKYLNAITQVAIVRSPREHYRGVWAAISLMRSVGSRPFSPRVLHVGGTIRSCQKSLVAVDRERLKAALQSTKSTGVLACVFVCGGGGGGKVALRVSCDQYYNSTQETSCGKVFCNYKAK